MERPSHTGRPFLSPADRLGRPVVAPDRVEQIEDLTCEIWVDCRTGKTLKLCLHPGGHITPKPWLEMAIEWANGVSATN